MALPTFDGKFEDWQTFQDLFLSSVHRNTTLSGSQKLQYLKTCTKGEAASLIKSFVIRDANYREAWQLLEQQYDNKTEIVHSHVRKLLSQPSLKAESTSSLQNMLTITLESIRSLKVLGRPVDQWDDLITVLLIDKFDGETKAEWARSLRVSSVPSFQGVQDFIQQYLRTLHAKGSVAKQCQPRQQSTQQGKRIDINQVSSSTSSSYSCQYCKGTHLFYQCATLKEMDKNKRHAAVKAFRVCLNCLSGGHMSRNCTSQRTCRKCNHRHNTFLHLDSYERKAVLTTGQQHTQEAKKNQDSSSSSSPSTLKTHTSSFSSQSSTLLKTALMDVMDNRYVKRSLRVFIDEGGEGGLIKEARMRELGLRKEKANVTITGVCGTAVIKSKWKFVRLYSKVNNSSIDVELFAVPKVTGVINKLEAGDLRSWSHIAGLKLADPQFYQGGEIDILIGSNIAPYILQQGLKKLDTNSPVAQDTIFGWVLFGNVGAAPQSSFKIHHMKCEISHALRKFWEIEEIPTHQPLTQEEQACENHFVQNHSRQFNGRYTVRLPFNEKKALLGESRDQALRRLYSLERRFTRNPQFKEAYIQFMQEY